MFNLCLLLFGYCSLRNPLQPTDFQMLCCLSCQKGYYRSVMNAVLKEKSLLAKHSATANGSNKKADCLFLWFGDVFNQWMHVSDTVCVWERESENESEWMRESKWERESEWEREQERTRTRESENKSVRERQKHFWVRCSLKSLPDIQMKRNLNYLNVRHAPGFGELSGWTMF